MRKIAIAFVLLIFPLLAAQQLYIPPFTLPATTCTNQFIRSLAAATGVGTCATVGSSDLTSSLSLTTPNVGVASATSINFGGSTLANYVIGSWTPADGSGAGLSFASISANYTRIGNIVFAYAAWSYPATADGTAAKVSGFPITPVNAGYGRFCEVAYQNAATELRMLMTQGATTAEFFTVAGAAVTNIQMSGSVVIMQCIYPVT